MTAFVISSTNSGTPSVLAAISSSNGSGRLLPRVMCATIACIAARVSRFSASRVTTGWLPKDATKIGRAVIITSTRALCTPSSASSISSRVVGSIQCASSITHSTGLRLASPVS